MSYTQKRTFKAEDNTDDFKVFKNQKKPKNNELYRDDIFPPNDNSLLGKNLKGEYLDSNEGKYKMINNQEIEWKRISDIIPKPVIFENIIDINNLRFGRLSYIYFYSVLSALSHFPSIFNKIILTKEYNSNGFYKLLLFIDGEFQIVYIDDYFPCIKNSNILYFIKPSNFEFWALLIEKAWAKVNGGYQNIINSWPVDLFKALTGSSCEELIHEELSSEELFNELNYADKNNGFCISLSNSDKEVVKKGLLNYHMYILVETEKIEMGKNLFLYLCKFKDPTGESNWIGDWNEKSELWNEKIRKKINKNKLNIKKGEFWMCIEDIKKYFIRSDVCHMIYDGFSKYFEFTNKELLTPKIFNFYLQEEGIVSVSIYEKNWHYHRELRYVPHPTSLIIAEYDVKNNLIKNIYTAYESNNDVEITKNLQKGYYLVWAYKTNDINEKITVDEMRIRFCSDAKLSIKFMGNDENFELIKNIIYQNIKEKNTNKIKNNEIFYATENSFKKSGLGYKICVNPSDTSYQEWKVDSYKIDGYILFPPYNKENFDLTIGYNDYKIILGIKKQKIGDHWFNLNVEVIQYYKKAKKDLSFSEKSDINLFFSKDNKSFQIIKENPTFSYEEIKTIKKQPTFDHWQIFLEKYKKKYPFIINELYKLKQLDNEKLDLVEIEVDNNIYIGEADYIIRNGRGGMIFGNEGTYYVGYWENGRQYNRGKVFDRKNNLLYDGEYKKGLKDGNGVYYYPSGEKYEGKFTNGVKEGKGIFYWKDGSRWEGYFKNDEMNGEGIFYNGDESYSVIYKNGEMI